MEEKKKQKVDTRLIIVTGLHGSGKTTYSQLYNSPVIHIDDYFDYKTKNLDYSSLSILTDYYLFLSKQKINFIILDGYIFNVDEDLLELKKAIYPIQDILIDFVYTNPEELYSSQRSTPQRIERMKIRTLSKEDDMRWSTKQQHILKFWTDDLLDSKRICSIEYLYREGDLFKKTNEEHFLKTIGVEERWAAAPWEVLSFVIAVEGVQEYQTIEMNGEIIRPGTEKCWISWENISSLGIDWNNKYVCDMGCYLGYFSLQILKNGAKKVLGIDRKNYLVNTYKDILFANGFRNFEALCIALGNGNNLPDDNYDIVVALNMLHHIERVTTPEFYYQVLESIFRNTKEALFEINDYQIEQIRIVANKFNFQIRGEIKSHRNTMYGQRYIMHFVKQ